MNFTRWSARLPGTQRRTAARAAIRARARSSDSAETTDTTGTADTPSDTDTGNPDADRDPGGAGGSTDTGNSPVTGGSTAPENAGGEHATSDPADGAEGAAGAEGPDASLPDRSEPGMPYAGTDPEGARTAGAPREAAPDRRTDTVTAPTVAGARSRPAAEAAGREGPDGPATAYGRRGAADTGAAAGTVRAAQQPAHAIDSLPIHALLGQVPALAAVVHGAEHRIAFVNEAYVNAFGPRPLGAPAREAMPELVELGLLPLMDQVRRSGTPRTVKSRRVPKRRTETVPDRRGPAPAGTTPGRRRRTAHYYTFTCTPITTSGDSGVLIFAAEVTDQVEALERLRTSERRQREAAVTLQRSLLPQELEQPDDLRVAATYLPGGTDAAVGGDWYDVITLGAGRTALVIGDVMGRGVRAAAVMGQLRTAVRAYARLDLPPHEVLQLLDGLAAEIDANQIATCVYAVHDPNEGCLAYASAGHVPILVRDPEGTVRVATEHTGPPLGTGGWLHTSGSLPLPPGATAVLYTDGLIERRDADIDEGVTALEQAFAGASGSPDIICDRLLRALGISEDHDDDVALLVCQHPERTGQDAELFHNATLDLLGGTEAAPRARAFASGVLASWRFPAELRDLGVLATSELVANSLQHGVPPMRLRLRRTDRRLIIEVTDGDEHLPRRRRAEPADESGRGISIVATIATSWGCRRTPGGGKSVWCEFVLPGC